MAVEAVSVDPVRVTVFLHSEDFMGLSVSLVESPDHSVFLRRDQVKVLSNQGFFATIELPRNLASRKRLI